jgi:hypothetical protein
VRLAAQGLRDLDRGVEPIAEPVVLRSNRRVARRIHAVSLGLASVLTALALLPPGP